MEFGFFVIFFVTLTDSLWNVEKFNRLKSGKSDFFNFQIFSDIVRINFSKCFQLSFKQCVENSVESLIFNFFNIEFRWEICLFPYVFF